MPTNLLINTQHVSLVILSCLIDILICLPKNNIRFMCVLLICWHGYGTVMELSLWDVGKHKHIFTHWCKLVTDSQVDVMYCMGELCLFLKLPFLIYSSYSTLSQQQIGFSLSERPLQTLPLFFISMCVQVAFLNLLWTKDSTFKCQTSADLSKIWAPSPGQNFSCGY